MFSKQKNKPFKGSTGVASSTHKKAGRVERAGRNLKSSHLLSKAERRNQARLVKEQKRRKIMDQHRTGTREGPPKVLGLIPLSPSANLDAVREGLLANAGAENTPVRTATQTFFHDQYKQRFTVVQPRSRDILSVLDIAKVADILLLVIVAPEGVDDFGFLSISSIRAQGPPSAVAVVQEMDALPHKKQHLSEKEIKQFFEEEFPEQKIRTVVLRQATDFGNVFRWASTVAMRRVRWREKSGFMLVEDVDFLPGTSVARVEEIQEDEEPRGTLVVTGYVRGNAISANQLIQVVNYGTYKISKIERVTDPVPAVASKTLSRKGRVEGDGEGMADATLLDAPDNEQDDLIGEMELDPMAGEQTWPTHEELMEAEASNNKVVRVPKGFSAYQARWITDESGEVFSDFEGSEDEEMDEFVVDSMGAVVSQEGGPSKPSAHGNALRKGRGGASSSMAVDSSEEDEEDSDVAEDSAGEGDMDFDDEGIEAEGEAFSKLTEEERREEIKKAKARKEEEEDFDFEDEVEVPFDLPARIRFQKYRGLKSMRTSKLDPKENLPLDYGRIFQFENPKKIAQYARMEVEHYPATPGMFVRIFIDNVEERIKEVHDPRQILMVASLLRFEYRLSVLQFSVLKHPSYTDPVKSKDPLLFHCGFRTFHVEPLFSEHSMNQCNHKFEKFLRSHVHTMATVVGPACFPPTPLLVFRESSSGSVSLVATGALDSINPDRIILKRIVLTALPFKIHKRVCVCRFMFHNPEDIKYWQSVDLWTKYGRSGRILEPLGTHGHMKCSFDRQITHQDTVCMSLYKRVFPRFSTKQFSLLH